MSDATRSAAGVAAASRAPARTARILQVDAFTDRPFAGNPAGVVLDADGIADGEMQAIAAEMNVADTAFLAGSSGSAALRLRWFTPSREVTYCGHATIATAHALVEAGRLAAGDRVAFETLGGRLVVEVDAQAAGPLIWLAPPAPRLVRPDAALGEVVAAAGVRPDALARWAPITLTAERDLLVPVAGLAALRALAPDMAALASAAAAAGLRGVCTVSRETVEPASVAHSRFFAPHYGIVEDPVTGSVHSSIALWLLEAGRLPMAGSRGVFTAEQGDGLGRPGRLRLEVDTAAGAPARIRVGGRAVTVLDGRIALPDAPAAPDRRGRLSP